jgi:D-alanyl-D-alanine carboxypeptidase
MSARCLFISAFSLGLIVATCAPAGAAGNADQREQAPSRYTLAEVAKIYGFNGVLLGGTGDAKPVIIAAGTDMPARFAVDEAEKRTPSLASTGGAATFDIRASWRWASVTKQIVATLIMQEVAAGKIGLDNVVADYVPGFGGPTAGQIKIRDLLRHQSGLPNPDETAPDKAGVPGYYSPKVVQDRSLSSGWCAGQPKADPGGNAAYNNCDYIVAGAVLEAVTGKSWQSLVDERIAKPLRLKSVGAFPKSNLVLKGFDGEAREPDYRLDAFGAAGALHGSPLDLWAFDRALLSGKLLPQAQRDIMWDGQPELGYAALGQWAFPATIKSCGMTVRVIERRGAIGGVQLRNFILPEQDMVVIAFTNRGEFDFGEIWQGEGFSHDLLAAALCPGSARSVAALTAEAPQ